MVDVTQPPMQQAASGRWRITVGCAQQQCRPAVAHCMRKQSAVRGVEAYGSNQSIEPGALPANIKD